MYHIYIDAEFDAIKINKKFYQMVVSLGAVMADEEGNQLDTFYSLVKPYNFKCLTSVVKRMTKLNDEDILAAPSLVVVEHCFKTWVHRLTQDDEKLFLYSFGPDDKRTISQNCTALKIDEEGLFTKMKDVQKELSASVCYLDNVVSKTLSLDDMKAVYEIEGIVDHNALSDAIDLMKIHQAFLRKQQPSEAKIVEIVNRKARKQQQVQERQRRRLSLLMKQRFRVFPTLDVKLVFYQEIIEYFHSWEDRDYHFSLHCKGSYIVIDTKKYLYEELLARLCVDIASEVPSVTMYFTYQNESFEKKFLLNYRNATSIENIIRRMSEEVHGV
ncbi:MAG: exonuclease domain-containing protein [Longicatena sp.]